MKQYKQLFTKEYWVDSISFFKDVKKLVFLSLLMAMLIILDSSLLSIPIIPGELEIKLSFLIVCCIAYTFGPFGAITACSLVDIISYSLTGGKYPFFIGYTLSAALGGFIYAILLYKQKVNFINLFIARLLINGIVNVGLGTLWMSILNPKSYQVYFYTRLLKNTILLPLETYALFILLYALIPQLKRGQFIPEDASIAYL